MNDGAIIKEFKTKDAFYNNGLVNLKIYLDEYNNEEIKYELTSNKLILEIPKDKDNQYFNEILKGFLINNNIVFQTNNDRLYWDKENKCFTYDKRYDIQGKSSPNDVKYLYKYITPKKIGKTTEKLFMDYLDFANKNNLSKSNIKTDQKIFKKDSKYKSDDKCDIPVFMTRDEAYDIYFNYLVNESACRNTLTFDSKIHQFEDGGFCFRDMLLNKNNYIDKWDALVYWCGVKVKRFYNSSYYIYLNSMDLLALYEMKRSFPNGISDEAIQLKDEKKGIVKNIPTNVNMSYQLRFDGIQNDNFYISNSINEFQLKFFMYMASHIYHIENMYVNADEVRIKNRKEKLYNSLPKISFLTYTEDGNMKSTLGEYTKVYRVIMFFKKLMEVGTTDSTLFKYFADLITAIILSKGSKEKINLNIKSFCEDILKFSDLRKIYYEVSFKILRNNTKNLGKYLYEFQNMYLQETKRGEYTMGLHSKSKKLGEEIGFFSANKEDKDLLFKLRNVKNHNQMIGYFKDLKFAVLRDQDDAKFSSEFNNVMEEIFIELEENQENWEIIRDYIAIYAIDKYRAVSYAKQLKKGGK